MKNSGVMIIMLVLSTLLMVKILISSTNPELDKDYITEVVDGELYLDTISKPVEIPNKFNYVYSRFSVFNPELDSSTVFTFNEVCEHYGLDSTVVMLEWCVGQILLESGAKQYYEVKHPKSGMLVESYAGAIGITQIMPTTAYYNLNKCISEEERIEMYEMGCTSFTHIIDSTYTKVERINMTREWLTNETNNFILWGYIMRSKLDKRPNILKVLVAYNSGTTGMINYVNNGGILDNHKYVKGIQTKLNYAEVRI